jgi:hypothetical protein
MQKAHMRRRLARKGCLFNQETRMRKPLSEPTEGRTSLSRRTLFAGASTVGALAAAAVLIPRVKTEEAAAVAPRPAPEKGGGYSLSDHVKQYYKTTLI